MQLIIGNKNYSSWSLRPWLLLKAHNVEFEEIIISLCVETTKAEITQYSKAGKVPILRDNKLVVWDSLAICEYISEKFLANKGWPGSIETRAEARACCAQMHSGFFLIRQTMPMNCRAQNRKITLTDELQNEIAQLTELLESLLKKSKHSGPWLFGDFSIADCMFAPIVLRFKTYDIHVSPSLESYFNAVLSHPAMKLWLQQAANESETIAAAEVGI